MIEGKVVKILDKERVVTNIGKKQGVKNGMKFIIYNFGEEIIDNETNESLGRLEIVKHHVSVVSVQEKISVMRSDEFVKIPGINSMAALTFTNDRVERKSLKINIPDLPQPNSSDDNLITVGDLVKEDLGA